MTRKRLNKYYFEYYALFSLIECYDKGLEVFLTTGNNECPDFQSDKLDLGIEVTEAIRTLKGMEREIISYDTEITCDEFGECLHRIKSSIEIKTSKLNRLYKKYNRNWLYIFTHNVLVSEDDIKKIFDDREFNRFKDYDRIFIDCIDKIYMVECFESIKIIYVDFEKRKKIREKLFEIFG